MIDPGAIPQIPGDMEALTGHAAAITRVGAEFAGTGQHVHATWQGLAGVYHAPEAAHLFTATAPVQAVAGSVGEDITAVGAALTAYASEVAEIKRQLAVLQSQAGSFVTSVTADDDWRDDHAKVEQHNALIQSVNTQIAAFLDAQRRCANTINALHGGPGYRADDGDSHVQNGEYGFTADTLNTAAAQDGVLPWGSTTDHDRGFPGDLSAYFGGIRDGFTTMLGDLGSLIGRDPTTGEWNWSAAGTAWTGVGTFAYAAAIYTNPVTITLDQSTGMPGLDPDEAGTLLLNAGKTLIAYDEWGHDNARAAGMTTFNIASAIIGTKGAATSLRTAGTATHTIRGTTAARISTSLTHAGTYLDNLPTTTQLTTRITTKLNLHIPTIQLGPIPAFTDSIPSRGHRFDVETPGPRRPEPLTMDTSRSGNHGPSGDDPGGDGPGANSPGGEHSVASSLDEHPPLDRDARDSGTQDPAQDGRLPGPPGLPDGHYYSPDTLTEGAGNPSVEVPPTIVEPDPFDQLDSATQRRLIENVMSDSNPVFPMTRENAEAVLRGGPSGTTPRVAGEGVAGGDVQFVDAGGNTVFVRENKSIGGGYNSFNKEIRHAASNQLNGSGEVWVQVRPGTDVDSWIRKFQGSRPAERLVNYAGVDVIFRDPSGNVLGRYNLGTRPDLAD